MSSISSRIQWPAMVLSAFLLFASPTPAAELSPGDMEAAKEFALLNDKIKAAPYSVVEQLVSLTRQLWLKNNLNVQLVYVNDLSPDESIRTRLFTHNDKTVLQFSLRPEARKNPFFLLEALVFLTERIEYQEGTRNIFDIETARFYVPKFPMRYIELLSNANKASIFSQLQLAEMESRDLKIFEQTYEDFSPLRNLSREEKKKYLLEYANLRGIPKISAGDSYENLVAAILEQLKKIQHKKLIPLQARAKMVYREQTAAYEKDAALRNDLVKSQSLPEMVKANDREGVARVMEAMLPWPHMEPSEKAFWTGFVDSIRHPNYENPVILFRGMDPYERAQQIYDPQKNLVGLGLFSKRLTKGSGSHLSKLKGLAKTFETFGVQMGTGKRTSPVNEAHTLAAMLSNHASDPIGSPFISFSYDLKTAFSFGQASWLKVEAGKDNTALIKKFLNSNQSGGVMTVRLDPRRVLINSIGLYSELEVLASMLIFPDEVMHFQRGVHYYYFEFGPKGVVKKEIVLASQEKYYEQTRRAVYEKTGVVLPPTASEYMMQGTKKFEESPKEFLKLLQKSSGPVAVMCSAVFSL